MQGHTGRGATGKDQRGCGSHVQGAGLHAGVRQRTPALRGIVAESVGRSFQRLIDASHSVGMSCHKRDIPAKCILERENKMTQPLITRNENILGGIPVFTGTRVPVNTLFDYLKANHSLEDFLDDFPTVARNQAVKIIGAVQRQLQEPTYEVIDEIAA